MRRRYLVTLSIAGTLALSATLAGAQTYSCDDSDVDTTYTGPTGGGWHYIVYWDNGTPDSGDVACIPDGKLVIIPVGYCMGGSNSGNMCNVAADCPGGTCYPVPAEAAAMWLLGDPGEYNLNIGGTLSLYGDNDADSRINGKFWMAPSSEMVIVNDVTIRGDGGVMEGEFGGTGPAVISGNGTLTLQGDDPTFSCEGGSNPGEPCDHPDFSEEQCGENGVCRGSLLLNERFTIEAPLVNNAGVVCTGHSPTVLTEGKKSGSGYWKVTDWDSPSGGLLVVDCELELHDSTPGDPNDPISWKIGFGELWGPPVRVDSGTSFSNLTGAIEGGLSINYGDSQTVSWDFAPGSGSLYFSDDFTTTGNLEMSGGTITVVAGHVVQFDVDE